MKGLSRRVRRPRYGIIDTHIPIRQGAETMAKPPGRTMLSRLVDAYDRIAEESLGMGDPEFHEIEDQLFDAIDDSGYRAVIKDGSIYLPDPNGSPGELILVDPAEPEDVDDPSVLNLDQK
jgi:hypothetical protein